MCIRLIALQRVERLEVLEARPHLQLTEEELSLPLRESSRLTRFVH
jgi:hypothetical protein